VGVRGRVRGDDVIGLSLVAAGGLDLLPFEIVGVAGAILYTLPPVRAPYRPFVGEAIAFVCLVDSVLGAHLLQGPSIDLATVASAVAVAAYAVSMLMVHHYLDRDADAGADPPKVTSIVYLGLVRGRHYAIGWCLLPLVVGYTAGLIAHLRCRPGDVASVTATNETVILFAGIASALAAAALLEPPLALTLLAAAALIALEMRMAVAPAHTPAA
jgi:1,4-dihydroxy-2-naphthoate octaprenyltransferase